ncbi:MAG: hypothetical protein NDJ90_15875 [Oligoflexia bacterium]|nr:hypothetical protein [Oligoflexia bacterium]
MKARNTQATRTQNSQGQTVEVLYQKMGDRWFAFSCIDDEVFVGSITPEEIRMLEAGEGIANANKQKLFKFTGNS